MPYFRISDKHRDMHRSTLAIAARSRADGVFHARLMAQAAAIRFYFQTFRRLGD